MGRPCSSYFKPAGIPVKELEVSSLSLSEFEALRLKDAEGLDQEACANEMDISQPTFHRLITAARKKVASAIVNGNAIRVEGNAEVKAVSDAVMQNNNTDFGSVNKIYGEKCLSEKICICPSCSHEQPHKQGVPCRELTCPKCGVRLIRK